MDWLTASQAKEDQEICKDLYDMIREANNKMRDIMARQNPQQNSFNWSSTLQALSIHPNRLFWISVGNSRIYLLREANLYCLTRDHVHLLNMLRKAADGVISYKEAFSDPKAKTLVSYIGMPKLTEIDCNIKPLTLLPGDKIIMCSDSIYSALTKDEMIQALSQDEDQAVKALKIKMQAAQPYQDNYTAIVISIPKPTSKLSDKLMLPLLRTCERVVMSARRMLKT